VLRLHHKALDLLGVSEVQFAGLCVPAILLALIVAYLYTKDQYKRL
jgi:hypothetical protein